MLPANSGKRASTAGSKKLPVKDCPICAAINLPTCILHHSGPNGPEAPHRVDALIRDLFNGATLPTRVFTACMTLQARGIKTKGQSEILLRHASPELVAEITHPAETAFAAAQHSSTKADRPPQKAFPIPWYFQTRLRKTWSRHYAKQSCAQRVAEQLSFRAARKNTKADCAAISATDVYARRLAAISAQLHAPPPNLRDILGTFARAKRSSRLSQLLPPSPAPPFPDECDDNFDCFIPSLSLTLSIARSIPSASPGCDNSTTARATEMSALLPITVTPTSDFLILICNFFLVISNFRGCFAFVSSV